MRFAEYPRRETVWGVTGLPKELSRLIARGTGGAQERLLVDAVVDLCTCSDIVFFHTLPKVVDNMAEEAKDAGYVRAPDSEPGDLSRLLRETDLLATQRRERVKLLKRLEDREAKRISTKAKRKTVAAVGFFCSDRDAIDADDVPALGDALTSVGDVDQIDLILNGPGGDGMVAEKMIELCRGFCKTFRVLVPNRAKSAATIIALGADKIVMGHASELGPIDAQVLVVSAGMPRYISAQSFIDARDSLESRLQEVLKAGDDPRGILQQLATLDPPLIDHCEKLMDFSRDIARTNLERYMFRGLGQNKRDASVAKILDRLSAVKVYKVHGRMIDGRTAKTDLGLDVLLLAKDSEEWKDLWNYYLRSDFIMRMQNAVKLVECRNEALFKKTVVTYA